jgi:hypothetical protein
MTDDRRDDTDGGEDNNNNASLPTGTAHVRAAAAAAVQLGPPDPINQISSPAPVPPCDDLSRVR